MSSEDPPVPPVADPKNPTGAEQCSLEEFFLQTPPGSLRTISSESSRLIPFDSRGSGSGRSGVPPSPPSKFAVPLPDLKLHCSSTKCGGLFWFKPTGGSTSLNLIELMVGETSKRFVDYVCKSCEKTQKTYAVWFRLKSAGGQLLAYKFGEDPDYAPPLPARVLRLVQSDADLFKKGWKAEKLGFGICAFTYYRRIVENHKNELFDKIIEIAEDEQLVADKIAALRHARDHTQFSQSMDAIKEAIPESLKMLGHNPLSLLHDAFSKGVHELSDEQCLKRAHAVRTILIGLAERFARIRAENDELKQALSSIFKDEPE
jgi:hypothetical protein